MSEAPPPPPAAGPVPGGPPPPQLPAAGRVHLAVQRRGDTDYIFNYWTALGWTIITFGIYGLYVFYQLVRRMRDHNQRRLEVLDAATAFAWEEAGRAGRQDELRPEFQRLAGALQVPRQMTADFRDPLVWMLLSLLAGGIVHAIAFVLLDQDLVKHDAAERGAEAELAAIFARLGRPIPGPEPGGAKGNHNYVGRIVAAIFSLGFYTFWWTYDIMVEANRHFERNWRWEDTLDSAVGAAGEGL
jgi:hypothetical protein